MGGRMKKNQKISFFQNPLDIFLHFLTVFACEVLISVH